MASHLDKNMSDPQLISSDGRNEPLNQLNQLFRKMIHCFKSLKTPHADDAC